MLLFIFGTIVLLPCNSAMCGELPEPLCKALDTFSSKVEATHSTYLSAGQGIRNEKFSEAKLEVNMVYNQFKNQISPKYSTDIFMAIMELPDEYNIQWLNAQFLDKAKMQATAVKIISIKKKLLRGCTE